jgi:glycosyltransferase involved in cell wall biosynthesis
VSPNKIITIYNGIDLDVYSNKIFDRKKIRKNFGIKEDQFVFGILAALRPEKRHDIFIEAASKVVLKIPNAKFMIVGGGYKNTIKHVKELISKHKLESNFLLTGVLGNVVPALSAFDVSVLCSDTEGMSNSVIQSIAMSKATIVTNVGGNPEVIEDGVNGVLIPADDPESLAESMIELFKNSTKRQEMEVQALKIATEKFNIFPIIKMLEDVYTEILRS